MAERLPSLQARVVLSSAAVSALVGLLAATGAALLVQQQQQAYAEQRLLDTASLFARELGEGDAALARQLADENLELLPLGLQLTLFEDGALVGGEASLAGVEGCLRAGAQLACALRVDSRKLVATGPRAELPLGRWLFAIALATLLSAAIGALVSRVVGAWAVRSLRELQRRVASGAALELDARASTAEVEALREALQGLVLRLREALERAQVFASGAAHELRTPLATLSAELELLGPGAPREVKETAQRALRTLRRLTFLVDRLLALAQGEHGAQKPFEVVALEDVVREVAASRPEGERARLRLVLEDPGMLRGDEALLLAVVDNLIDNSLKFTEGPVAVRVRAVEQEVQLEVEDGGAGISAAQLPALLKPFARGESGTRGSGLGLAIVSRAVALHGGSFGFEGPKAEVRFPAWRAAPP